jgi:hypothetical protein
MIGFFPDPYPDELFYSACARYAERVNYPNKQSHIAELLGYRGLSAIVDLPNRLDYFVSILPPKSHYSAEGIINENTLLSFYEPFLPSYRAELVRHEMKDSFKNNNLRSRAGITIKQVQMPDYLRFCPLCVKNDKNEYGETFWRRLHQLPGILVCPEHLCFLENSSLEWKRGIGSHFYSAEDYILQKKLRFLKQNNTDHQVLIKLAENAKWLLSQNHISVGNEVIRDRYYNQLLKNELAYYNSRIRNNKLFKEFQDFYSPTLLESLGCSIESTHRSWIFRIVEKSKTDIIHHPVRHFLMMNFLGFTAEEFFTSFVEFKPFADSPYPCLSRASTHFGELRIPKCEVFDNLTKGEKRGKPIAVFSCDCGFIYQRVGPDKSENNRFRYDSIREYGTQWENKLREMWNDLSLSRAEIARRLGISDLSVTNIAHRLNFPMNTPETRISNDKAHRKPARKTLSESRKIYRKEWNRIFKENPQANRNKLIKLANFEYLWLMRNDSKWMESHLPKVLKVPRKKEILDWKKIDNELSDKVKKACQEIYLNVPIKRVCITEILRKIGYKKWLEKRELKLPKTTQILNKQLETLEDYMIRKLMFAEVKFIEEKIMPTRNRLIRQAVIENHTTKTSQRIQEEITKSLKRIENSI